MSRLVVVSNRIASPETGASAGGLAVGLMGALKNSGGLWFGWNGEINDDPSLHVERDEHDIEYASFSLTEEDYEHYYCHFSNTVIWPAFHYRLDLVEYHNEDYDGYCHVNKMLVERLKPLLKDDDVLWIHDYHLLPFASACRAQGINNRIGFFLHIPFPTPEVFNALPPAEELLQRLCDYDLLGFQTESDSQALIENISAITELSIADNGRYQAFGKIFSTAVYPIGIEPDEIAEMAQQPLDGELQTLNSRKLGRKTVISVERLDYSKGLPDRFRAYETFLEQHPEHHGKVRYTQIAPTSRSDVQAYQDIRHELETESGRINGRFATMVWTPIHYINQHYDREALMKIFRYSDVGLVTPLRDGMNLVAKEFVAAQDPEDPGVLILSVFAGAANELTEALLVNPYDRDEVADALAQALTMGKKERIERYQAMMEVLRTNDIRDWGERFMADLVRVPLRLEVTPA